MWYLALGELKEGDQFDASIHAAAENALREEGVTIRSIDKGNLAEEMRRASPRSTTRPGPTTGGSCRRPKPRSSSTPNC